MKYSKEFKEQAIRLSDEIAVSAIGMFYSPKIAFP